MTSKFFRDTNDFLHKDEYKFWTAILIFSALVFSFPYFSFEFIHKTDTLFHLCRVEGIKEGLLALEIPVRINGYALNGYGTADGIMYPDLFLYIAAFFRILGLSVGLSWNLMWIFTFFAGIFASWYGFSLWSKNIRAGALAAIFFTGMYIYQIIAGDMAGQVAATFFMPLAFASLVMILRDGKTSYWLMLAISGTLIFQNHIITMMIFCVMALAVCLYYKNAFKHKPQRDAIIKVTLFLFLLNIWRIVPFLYFYETVAFQVNHPSWINSFADMNMSVADTLRWHIYLGFPLIFFTFYFLTKSNVKNHKGFLYSALGTLFLIVICTRYFPWRFIEETFPFVKILFVVQMQQRFLFLGVILLCAYVGLFLAEKLGDIRRKKIRILILLVFISLMYSTESLVKTVCPEYLPLGYIYSRENLQKVPSHTKIQEDYLYSDVKFRDLKKENGDNYDSADYKTDSVIFDAKKQATRLEFSYIAKSDTKVQVPLFYWQGYEARNETGERLNLNSGEHRFMEVEIPKGEGRVFIHYAGLLPFRIFDIVSFVSLIMFLYFWRKEWKNYG
ncbi:MAG: hypothetical protein IKN43_06050 [Selenomonadaceae bacterium]|nr:hypothetical protein [Selenomonadaceae bacterium]